jgi:hypothetical protein
VRVEAIINSMTPLKNDANMQFDQWQPPHAGSPMAAALKCTGCQPVAQKLYAGLENDEER